MDIHIKNCPTNATVSQLEKSLRPHLKEFQIFAFYCEKRRGKPFATLTIHDATLANRFLQAHGGHGVATAARVVVIGTRVSFVLGRSKPSAMLIQCLHNEHNKYMDKAGANEPRQTGPRDVQFDITVIENGVSEFESDSNNLVFHYTYRDPREAQITFGKQDLVIKADGQSASLPDCLIKIKYDSVVTIAISKAGKPAILLTLERPPTFVCSSTSSVTALANHVAMLGLNLRSSQSFIPEPELSRVSGLSEMHSSLAGYCLVYRLTLGSSSAISRVKEILDDIKGGPSYVSSLIRISSVQRNITRELDNLNKELSDPSKHGSLPFTIKFQLVRLALNGYLTPSTVSKLLRPISTLLKQKSVKEIAVVDAVRATTRTMSYAEPSADPVEFDPIAVATRIEQLAMSFRQLGSMYETVRTHENLILIHKIMVTPCGLYLEGPELEVKNRVLRKYPKHSDHFIRVQLMDEDSQQIRNEFSVSNANLFAKRFTQLMNGSITICGRGYKFLGFSHSSLRENQCWFMAPFWTGDRLMLPRMVVEDLGNFDLIRSPAKCAARIGQAFTDASDSIPLDPSWIKNIPDIERNGRCFTDGVGTISRDLLRVVWSHFKMTGKEYATVLQVRHAGAKGMVSLDYSLEGKVLCLRPSMIKFEGSNDIDLEICGAGYRRLPMYLNKQLVKILEDLGSKPQAFIDLQNAAVKQLEEIVSSPKKASKHLEACAIGTSVRLPSLIRMLSELDLNFRDDQFLRQVVDVAALMQLRNIKYRARIPVPQAHTLLGVADTTSILRQGEVYVPITFEKKTTALTGTVMVTRSPALHPGDVQLLKAVDVPQTSLLRGLHNCIVFSTEGDRDMPSCLSGGDLDGDLYNVITDKNLLPKRTFSPAEYNRVEGIDIGRKVQSEDITQFFLRFMESDVLGVICNTHLVVADQKTDGTASPSCVKLAEMASTAVDYSKTGIPVDIRLMPKDYERRCKPDFMYNGPRMMFDSGINFEDNHHNLDEPEDPTAVFTLGSKAIRYYRSEKLLGKLYRAIDETMFLDNVQKHDILRARSRRIVAQSNVAVAAEPIIEQVWTYVRSKTSAIPWMHHIPAMRQIREAYESFLIDTMWLYSQHRSYPLTEVEVICGTILGRNGAMPSKRARDSNMNMKGHFGTNMAFFIHQIRYGDIRNGGDDDSVSTSQEDDDSGDDQYSSESLGRTIACLYLGLKESGLEAGRNHGAVKSWKYVAAALCLSEVRYHDRLFSADGV